MSKIEKSILFNAPCQKVWQVWKDVEKTSEWVDGVSLSRIISEAKEGLDLHWREKCKVGGFDVQVDHYVKAWDEEKKVSVHSALPMGGTMDREIQFINQGESSKVNLTLTWNLGMAASLFSDKQMEEMMDRSLDRTAKNWKTQVENPSE
jgi:carbon monoxide dehydrogenase subunit G